MQSKGIKTYTQDTAVLLSFLFLLLPVFHSYLTSSLLCSYFFSSVVNAGHVLFAFLV